MWAVALLFLLAAPASASSRIPDQLDAMAAEGFKAMYRHDFARSEERFTAMTTAMPGHPAGYVFLASMYWWQYSNDFELANDALEKKFFTAARQGIACANQWKAGGGKNIEADFWLGGAYGIIGRWHVSQFEWIRAYLNGKKGYYFLKSVYQRDPENHDAALGVGEFEYLASRLPGMIRLTALLFVKGDRDGGIRACVESAEKGTFTTSEAKLFLAVIYNEHMHDFVSALRWMDSLIQDDPENQFFRMLRGIVRFYKRDYVDAQLEISSVLRQLEDRPGDPLRDILSMGYYHLGMIELLEQRQDAALAWFTKGVEEMEYPTKGWRTNCMLRRAQTHDILGRRKEALVDYAAVLKRPNFWDSRKIARAHQKDPASLADVMSQVFGEKAAQFERK